MSRITSFTLAAMTLLLAPSSQAAVPDPVLPGREIPAVSFPQETLSWGGVMSQHEVQVYVKWDLFLDPQTGRFVLLAGAGCPNGADQTAPVCVGVPGGGAAFQLTPPRLPFSSFCIDTVKASTKQPSTARASGIVISSAAGRGQPSISVQPGDGTVHVDKLCYPHNGDAFPHLWLGNSWSDENGPIAQVMTFALAGDAR